MKFKYYLRGAGIGIIVSAVILSAASLFEDNMSDAEVIQRAMELGMVMEEGPSGTLADIPNQGNTGADANTVLDDGQGSDGNGQNTDDPSDTPGNSQGTNNVGDPDISDDSGDAGNSTDPDTPSEDGKNADPDANAGQDDGGQDKGNGQDANSKKQNKRKDKITVKVEGGDVSRAVSQKVFDAGLVDDPEEFNRYLGDNGYASFLQPGTYQIKKGSSFHQIAEILTSR